MKKIALLMAVISVFVTTNAETNGIIKTRLVVTVLDQLGNAVSNAIVKIYLTKEDYQRKENEVGTSQFTNHKGKATFTGLEKIPYFIHAEKGDLNNVGSGIKTDTLIEFRINKITTMITDL